MADVTLKDFFRFNQRIKSLKMSYFRSQSSSQLKNILSRFSSSKYPLLKPDGLGPECFFMCPLWTGSIRAPTQIVCNWAGSVSLGWEQVWFERTEGESCLLYPRPESKAEMRFIRLTVWYCHFIPNFPPWSFLDWSLLRLWFSPVGKSSGMRSLKKIHRDMSACLFLFPALDRDLDGFFPGQTEKITITKQQHSPLFW